MLKIFILLAMVIAGCSTQPMPMPMPMPMPKPAPMPCEVKVKGECRELSSSERTGAVTRGHSEIKETQP